MESEAYRQGYSAYQNDIPIGDNPYNNNEEWELHLDWREGWHDAAWDD
jgi:hypothetical protein